MSNIEWTEQTWNPTTGCDRISPGCDNCYALIMAKRLKAMGQAKYQTDGDPRTSGPGFGVAMHDDVLTEPLRWNKPRRVFVNSMSDLFHAGVTRDFIVRTFAIMALTPQHTYQILTKRHGRLRSLLNDVCECGLGHVPGVHFRSDMAWAVSKANPNRIPGVPDDAEQRVYRETAWPLPNVWIGTSVEDQKRAELRISALIDTPAAVRFLSCEPLLGPVDLTSWLTPISPLQPEQAPTNWDDWTWPDWVPATVRDAIEGFWGADQYRTPRDWMRNMHEQQAPAFGARVTMDDGFGPDPKQVTGRYVHAWNNIGRLIKDDGTVAYTSFGYARKRTELPIDWVIIGGESGPGARPVNPDWVAGLSATAQAAGAATFVKQLGSVWATANSASDRKGGTPEDWPAELQVRQYPAPVKAGRR
ncbi:DUF5131 family protein [Streptomyces lavendulae]|uniref:DUF5131 family protein n=1 Tax=Streptomyces lavendulae TaxID=1914 RepID=UPI0036AF99DC